MADAFVQVQPDSSGKKIDTSEVTVGAQAVERQRVVLADGTDAAGLLGITDADPCHTDYALPVRQVPAMEDANLTHELLARMLDKLDQIATILTLKG